MCDHSQIKRIFTLISYNICISARISKVEMIICVIHNRKPDETIVDLIQRSESSVELKVPTIRLHTLVVSFHVGC